MSGERMSHRIPQETIDEIRRRAEIVEVISDYLPLSRAGRNFKALCPFHKEKTPSFMVSPERQAYHCFGCGAGGNAISFVMEYEGVGFVEALTALARRVGIAIPERRSSDPAERREKDAVHEVLRLASEHFRRALVEGSAGKEARDYLAERGIGQETGAAFGVGFAPPSWDSLLSVARRRGIPAEILVRAGLARRREGAEGHYDYFRHRLMFPIARLAGGVVGFGGRALGEEEPKYLNSPDTPVFRKGGNLYGIKEARDAMRGGRRAVVVEGYMDVLSLHQAGARNMVAPLGTAFVPEQARLLARFAPVVVLAFDGDQAGRRAAWSAGSHLWEAGLRARVALLPEGEDPDSLVRDRGLKGWEELLAGATDFVEFALAEGQPREEREEALRRLVSALARVRDELRRGMYLKAVAERAGIPEETLLRAVAAERKRLRRVEAAGGVGSPAGAGSEGEGGPPALRAGGGAAAERAEWDLLRLLLCCPELQEEAVRRITPDLFRLEGCREVARRLVEACRDGRELTAEELAECAKDPEMAAVVAAVVVEGEEGIWQGDDHRDTERMRRRALEDYLRRLRQRDTRQSLDEVEVRLREAQARGDVSASKELLRRVQEIKREAVTRSGEI